MTWNMAKNTQNRENENCTQQDLEYCEKSIKRGKEKFSQYDMKYGEKH